ARASAAPPRGPAVRLSETALRRDRLWLARGGGGDATHASRAARRGRARRLARMGRAATTTPAPAELAGPTRPMGRLPCMPPRARVASSPTFPRLAHALT